MIFMVIQERIKLLEEQLEENGELGEFCESLHSHFSRNKFYSAVLFADFFITKELMAYGTRLFAKFNLFIGAHGLRHKVQDYSPNLIYS